jgi:hypothetical protein
MVLRSTTKGVWLITPLDAITYKGRVAVPPQKYHKGRVWLMASLYEISYKRSVAMLTLTYLGLNEGSQLHNNKLSLQNLPLLSDMPLL